MIAPTVYPKKLQQLVQQEVTEGTKATPWESQITCIGQWQDADGLWVQLQLCIQKDENEFMEPPRAPHDVFVPEDYMRQVQHHRQRMAQLEADGVPALQRLLKVAHGDTGQCITIAKFLLGLYNARRFPFPLVDLRCLDDELFEDCMTVLRMDARACQREVHCYFENGGPIWEKLAEDWGLRDHTKAYKP